MADPKTDTDNSGMTSEEDEFLAEVGLGDMGEWSGPPDDESDE